MQLKDIENARKSYARGYIAYDVIMVLSLALLPVGLIVASTAETTKAMFTGLALAFGFAIGVVMVLCRPRKTRFKTHMARYKKALISFILENELPNATYQERGIANEIEGTRLVKEKLTHKEYEDIIRGYYKGIKYISSDFRYYLSYVTYGHDGASVHQPFDTYRYIIYTLNKRFDFDILVCAKVAPSVAKNGLSRVKIANNDFDYMFDVYSTDPDAANAFLTAEMMGKIMSIRRLAKESISLSIVDDKFSVLYGDGRRNHLDFSLYTPVDQRYFDQMLEDIKLIKDVLNTFDLPNLVAPKVSYSTPGKAGRGHFSDVKYKAEDDDKFSL